MYTFGTIVAICFLIYVCIFKVCIKKDHKDILGTRRNSRDLDDEEDYTPSINWKIIKEEDVKMIYMWLNKME